MILNNIDTRKETNVMSKNYVKIWENHHVTSIYKDHGKQLINDARLVIPFYDENNDLSAVSGRALETSDNSLRYVTI